MGDYFDMYSDEAGAHLAWAATFNGEQDVYYSVIKPSYVRIAEHNKNMDIAMLENFPNPFRDKVTIRYNLLKNSFISLKVFSLNGKEIATLINESQQAGMHEAIFSASGLESGVYYYRLQTSGSTETRRLVLLN
jgi:hypothetical protein